MFAAPEQQFSNTHAVSVWETDTGAGIVHNDNAWLLSFIDILALLLTLFVLLLAYEANGPDDGSTSAPLLQPEAAEPDIRPELTGPDMQAQLQVPVPFQVIGDPASTPGQAPLRLAPAEPMVIKLPLANVIAPPKADVPGMPVAQADPDASDAADSGTAGQVERLALAPVVQPSAQTSHDNYAPQHSPLPFPDATLARQPSRAPNAAVVADAGPDSTRDDPMAVTDMAPAESPRDALLAALADSSLGERLEVTVRPGVVNLEVSDNILFAPGSAALKADGVALLGELAETLAAHPFTLAVEGHTDNIPIQTARFPSNWELSSARAARVTRKLIEQGVAADRIQTIGYGATRPRADNDSPQGRSRNRRVSFVLQIPPAVPSTEAD